MVDSLDYKLSSVTCHLHLENDLQRKFRVQRLAWTDSGIAEVRSKCRSNLAAFAGEGETHWRKVCAVKDVEHIHTELRCHPLDDLCRLEERHVHRVVPGL